MADAIDRIRSGGSEARAVFAYRLVLIAPANASVPPHDITLFVRVGVKAGDGRNDWFIAHGEDTFELPNGGEGSEHEPVVACLARSVRDGVLECYPTEAKQKSE